MSDSQVVTRFAPSPTGALHVGGARTALFNWAYARQHGGKFILRIEDTDRARSTEEAMRGMLEDLAWLGIDWDEGPSLVTGDLVAEEGDNGPYCQSARLESGIYQKYFDQLVEAGRAYEDDGALRFRMPGTAITVADEILGQVTVEAEQLEDFVIRKADGFPTYHMAVVVDDELMGVNVVIRGQEHLNNTSKHVAIQEALGFERPRYAHIPLIFNVDGSKMSKRDKAKAARRWMEEWLKDGGEERWAEAVAGLEGVDVGREDFDGFMGKENDSPSVAEGIGVFLGKALPEVDVADFKESGYLAAALCNYLSLLGWNPGDDLEKFDNAFLAEKFSFERVNKSAAKFDRVKLASFNGDALKELPPEVFATQWREWCESSGQYSKFAEDVDKLGAQSFGLLGEAYKERAKTFGEACEMAGFFLADDGGIEFDAGQKQIRKNLTNQAEASVGVLEELKAFIGGMEVFSGEGVHVWIKATAEEREVNMGKFAQPLRIALSGTTVTPPIDLTLDVLGREKVLARIEGCLGQLKSLEGVG